MSLIPSKGTEHTTVGEKHRLQNSPDVPLKFIDIQAGDYLGGDDIMKFDDAYGHVEVLSENSVLR